MNKNNRPNLNHKKITNTHRERNTLDPFDGMPYNENKWILARQQKYIIFHQSQFSVASHTTIELRNKEKKKRINTTKFIQEEQESI